MSESRSIGEECPYCEPPYTEFTDDHIFPQFLGGRKTIRVCKKCNNSFGHSFEGRASQQLKRLQVFISHFGLDLARNPAVWPSALAIDDVKYDVMSGPEGTQYRLSSPIIRRDSEGRVVGGKARSQSEGNKLAKGLIESGRAKNVEIVPANSPTLEDVKLDITGSFDENIFRFSTKLAAAVAVASGYQQVISRSEIPGYLHGTAKWPTSIAFCDVETLRRMKPPLAHTVYLEMGEASYALVLIFGFKKIFVPLPASPMPRGILASLDPLTGAESFEDVEPIGPRKIPDFIREEFARAHIQGMLDVLAEDAVARGAKKRPDLFIGALDMGTPVPAWWMNSTARYMFRKPPFK